MHRLKRWMLWFGLTLTSQAAVAGAVPQFFYASEYWLNLHHFLYDLGVNQRRLSESASIAAPTDEEAVALSAAAAHYRAQYRGRNLLFDVELASIKRQLCVPAEASLPATLPAQLRKSLLDADAAYRRVFWPAHDRENRRWIEALQPLVEQHGSSVATRLERVLGGRFPVEPIHVSLVYAHAHRQGAYTERIGRTGHSVITSSLANYKGNAALEMLFHEASHLFVIDPVVRRLNALLDAGVQRRTHAELWHFVLFYTVGDIVAAELARAGTIDYVPYATRKGLYRRNGYDRLLHEHWRPVIDGDMGRDEALGALVAGVAGEAARR